MTLEKSPEKSARQNRVRDALGRIYDNFPPYFREYLRRYQEDPTSRVFAPLAEAYRRLGRVDEAIDICKEGLNHHPDFHGGRVTLAKCLIDKRRLPEARVELERVIQFVPENLLAQRLLGDVCLAQKDFAASLHAYKMALLLSPADVALAEQVYTLEKGEAEEATKLAPLPLPEEKVPAVEVTETVTVEPAPESSGVAEKPNSLAAKLEEPAAVPQTAATGADALLDNFFSDDDTEDEAFKIEHVSHIFNESQPKGRQEITTETLGDLYYSQGQFDRSLRIFEKLAEKNPSADLARKVNACRLKLGVGSDTILRNRKIEVLRDLLKRVQHSHS